MNELGLPPRRTLPPEVRERIRVAVNTDTTTDAVVPRANASARTKFAAAAAVVLAAGAGAGAVIIAPSMNGASDNPPAYWPYHGESVMPASVDMADSCLTQAQKASGIEAGASTPFSGSTLLMFRNGRNFGGTCVYEPPSEPRYLHDAADSTLSGDSPVPDLRWTTLPRSETSVVIGVFAVEAESVHLHFASGEPMVLSVVNRTFMSPPQDEQRVVTSVEVYGRDHALLYDGPLR